MERKIEKTEGRKDAVVGESERERERRREKEGEGAREGARGGGKAKAADV